MSNDEIRELIQLVTQSSIAELEFQRGEDRVHIRRILGGREEYEIAAPFHAATPVEAAPSASAQAAAAPSTAQTPTAAQRVDEHVLKSPIVGTFYECPVAGDRAFVEVGDAIEAGQILCLIESLKLMNEIESDIAGTVIAKLIDNRKPVEYGEPLFAIRPR